MKIRIYYNATIFLQEVVVLCDENFNYLKNVLRIKVGDSVFLFNNSEEYCCKVLEIDKKCIKMLVDTCSGQNKLQPNVTLYCPVIKKDAMSNIIRQCCELGVVKKIVPFISQNCNIKEVNTQRLLSIAKEAIEQCEAFIVPQVGSVLAFKDILQDAQEDVIYFGDEEAAREGVVTKLTVAANIGIIIGPEGGFSNEEINVMRGSKKFCAITLGGTILKCDTAALCLMFMAIRQNAAI